MYNTATYPTQHDDKLLEPHLSLHIKAIEREHLATPDLIAAELAHRDDIITTGTAAAYSIKDYIHSFGIDASQEVINSELGETLLRLSEKYLRVKRKPINIEVPAECARYFHRDHEYLRSWFLAHKREAVYLTTNSAGLARQLAVRDMTIAQLIKAFEQLQIEYKEENLDVRDLPSRLAEIQNILI